MPTIDASSDWEKCGFGTTDRMEPSSRSVRRHQVRPRTVQRAVVRVVGRW